MPFFTVDLNGRVDKKCNADKQFRQLWEESREEYRLIGEMITLRKQQKITQAALAKATGNKQQAISRIENKENAPSLKTFCNLLNALGYELQIVKQNDSK